MLAIFALKEKFGQLDSDRLVKIELKQKNNRKEKNKKKDKIGETGAEFFERYLDCSPLLKEMYSLISFLFPFSVLAVPFA